MGRRAVLCLLAAAVPFGCATRLQAHSFAAPFEDVDSAGNRCARFRFFARERGAPPRPAESHPRAPPAARLGTRP